MVWVHRELPCMLKLTSYSRQNWLAPQNTPTKHTCRDENTNIMLENKYSYAYKHSWKVCCSADANCACFQVFLRQQTTVSREKPNKTHEQRGAHEYYDGKPGIVCIQVVAERLMTIGAWLCCRRPREVKETRAEKRGQKRAFEVRRGFLTAIKAERGDSRVLGVPKASWNK